MRTLGIALLFFVTMVAACSFSVDLNQGVYQCQTNADCPAGFPCKNNRCVSPDGGGGSCLKSSDCFSGQACVENKCQRIDGGGGDSTKECQDDSDCPSGYCIENKCYQGGQHNRCRRPDQCQTGFLCETLFGVKRCLKRCSEHSKCKLEESCRPGFTNGISLCVPRCTLVEQGGCLSTQACILFKGRGYCLERRNKSLVGLQCSQDADCEVHLYCRPVKGYPSVRRCTSVCNEQRQEGCSGRGQTCVAFPKSQGNFPFGYCEPLPREGGAGDICGRGDLVCKPGLTCKAEKPYSRCR